MCILVEAVESRSQVDEAAGCCFTISRLYRVGRFLDLGPRRASFSPKDQYLLCTGLVFGVFVCCWSIVSNRRPP
jgi:hypothetical protein